MSRPPADPVTQWLAQIVQHHLVTGPGRPDLPPMPAEVTAVEAHPVGLATGILIVTAARNRYFIVTVSEFTTRE